ncbi:MAG: TPR repeat protein [Comamonadaceae bacterium]|nr:MAG: TPR repeat protein [Comamonadaceae bacterium]
MLNLSLNVKNVVSGVFVLRLLDCVVIVAGAGVIASVLGIQFLLSNNLPTGGDAASHLLYVWTYSNQLLPKGNITAWMPEVFAGFPFLSYYFPLSFIFIAGLATVLPFAPAMKLGMFAAAMLLPGTIWVGSVYLLRISRSVSIWGVLATLAFLLHEQNSIWGGNLLSTLAGEFAYSYGMLFSVLTLFAWQKTMTTGRYWWLAAMLEAATGFSHGFALLITGFATSAFLFERQFFLRNLRLLLLGHGLAFFLLAGWLWPMLQMHALTIPNDALFEISTWQDLLPKSMQPVLAAGLLAILVALLIKITPVLRGWLPNLPKSIHTQRHAVFMACAALLAGAGYLAGSSIGVANIRFFPFVWLFGGLACGWTWGILLERIASALPLISRWGAHLLSTAMALAFAAWISMQVAASPDWGLWNHSGLEAKPQWHRLSQLFPVLSGKLDSPRLTFEHDPANNDIGSTRALESLPMFLGGRPVLEGLYMESAPVGPAIYQLQSEVSRYPSSPLARFPSGSLDTDMAAKHMNFLYANEVLIRNEETYKAMSGNRLFVEIASTPPFSVFKLSNFNSHLVDLVDIAKQPLKIFPLQGWMETSFQWFRSRQRFDTELPVFHDGALTQIDAAQANARIHEFQMERHSLRWRTDAVGTAHLVRMAWHPRWQLMTKGKVYLAGPGFMLVVPDEPNVVLEYGHTNVGIAGMVATAIALLILFVAVFLDVKLEKQQYKIAGKATLWPSHWLEIVWPVVLIGVAFWFHIQNPERIYTEAWNLMRVNRHSDAALEFDHAFNVRKSQAKKEEALFWSAKAYELAGKRDDALLRYRQLTANFYGYWVAESLYIQSQLEVASGQTAQAELSQNRLMREYVNDKWAIRLRQEQEKK